MVAHGWSWSWYQGNLCHNTMLDHSWDNDWFSYWDNICHNTTSEHGWPLLTMVDHSWPWLNNIKSKVYKHGWVWLNMVDFHILITIWRWTMVDQGWPWLLYWDNIYHNMMLDHGWENDLFSYWDNICHNVTFDHGWPWLTMIIILRQYFSYCDVGP